MKSLEFITEDVVDALADLRKMAQVSESLLINEARNWTTLEKQYYASLPQADADDAELRVGDMYWPITVWLNERAKSIYFVTVIQPAEFIKQENGYSFFKYSQVNGQMKFTTEDVLLHEARFYYYDRGSVERVMSITGLMFGDWIKDMKAYDTNGNLRPLKIQV